MLAVAAAVGLFTETELNDLAALMPSTDRHSAPARWVVSVDSNQIAAIACIAPENFTIGTWNLQLIAVHPEHQRRGHGAALVSHLEAELHEDRQRLLLIDTSDSPRLAQARAFYRKCGYIEIARIPEFWEDAVAKVTFCKFLRTNRPNPE